MVQGRYMADLMGENAGELCLVVGERHQTAGDIDIAARGGERVDDLGIENRKCKFQVPPFRRVGQQLPDAVDIAPNLRCTEFSAELLDDLGVVLPPHANFLRLGQSAGKRGFPRCRVLGTTGELGRKDSSHCQR